MKLSWTGEASVEHEHGVSNVFQMGTYAVRAEMPDGTVKIRVLQRGLAVERPNLLSDWTYEQELREKLRAQTEPVHVEGATWND